MKTATPFSILSLLVSTLGALILWVTPQTAHTGTWKLCFRWTVTSNDSGVGEDYYTSGTGAPARHALLSLFHPLGQIGFYRLDDQGCFNMSSNYSIGFNSNLYADLIFGGTDDHIRVKGFASQEDQNNDNIARWSISSGSLGTSGGTRYFYVPADPMGRLMGYGQWITKRLYEEYTSRISGSNTMNLIRRSCEVPGSGSCAPYPDIHIQPLHENYKYLIGHEIGHWFHFAWESLLLPANSYAYSSNDPDCGYPNHQIGQHALRSVEYSAGAYVEGTAHFLSTLAFNKTTFPIGWFRYYKERVTNPAAVGTAIANAHSDMLADDYRVNVDYGYNIPTAGAYGGGEAWMRHQCPAEARAGYGTEMDWLRFWWDVCTDDMIINGQWASNLSTSQIFDFLEYARKNHGWGRKTVWEQLKKAIANPNSGYSYYSNAFTAIANNNGIDY